MLKGNTFENNNLTTAIQKEKATGSIAIQIIPYIQQKYEYKIDDPLQELELTIKGQLKLLN